MPSTAPPCTVQGSLMDLAVAIETGEGLVKSNIIRTATAPAEARDQRRILLVINRTQETTFESTDVERLSN